jgi:GNAT superfamily N-acetyltransferase
VIPEYVLGAARSEYQCVMKPSMDHVPIVADGNVVGLYTPRPIRIVGLVGTRLGPFFVLPAYRRRGLMRGVYSQTKGTLFACVRSDNLPSLQLHEACGFVRWRKYQFGDWWLRQ